MSNFLKGDKVRLKKSGAKIEQIRFIVDRDVCDIPFGTVFKVSTQTDAPIAKLDSEPTPLISKDFINRNDNIQDMFELVEQAD